jgi:outer membrane protein assembly factor BamB
LHGLHKSDPVWYSTRTGFHLGGMTVAWLRVSVCAGIFVLAGSAEAGDWPQILGPSRNGTAVEEMLPASLPAGGPKRLWEKPVGSGFAGVAVKADTVVLFHRQGKEEVVEALKSSNGDRLWRAGFPTAYVPTFTDDNGPRCVPVIHNDVVYAYGAGGNLHAVGLKDGKPRWSRAVSRDFQAPVGYFGSGSSPIIEGDALLVNAGGRGAGIVALSLKDGATLWKALEDDASYSSPVAVTQDGVRHLIFVTRLKTVSVDPVNGKVRWEFPFGQRGPTVNGASPVVSDGHVFVTASYGIGAVYARFGKDTVETIWENDDTLSSQYSTPVLLDGFLYGIHGRQDADPAALRCVELKSGKVQWSEADFGNATLILAGKRLLILKTDGTLVLAEANPKAFRNLGSARILDEAARGTPALALPALAAGRLYARDKGTLRCFQATEK